MSANLYFLSIYWFSHLIVEEFLLKQWKPLEEDISSNQLQSWVAKSELTLFYIFLFYKMYILLILLFYLYVYSYCILYFLYSFLLFYSYVNLYSIVLHSSKSGEKKFYTWQLENSKIKIQGLVCWRETL